MAPKTEVVVGGCTVAIIAMFIISCFLMASIKPGIDLTPPPSNDTSNATHRRFMELNEDLLNDDFTVNDLLNIVLKRLNFTRRQEKWRMLVNEGNENVVHVEPPLWPIKSMDIENYDNLDELKSTTRFAFAYANKREDSYLHAIKRIKEYRRRQPLYRYKYEYPPDFYKGDPSRDTLSTSRILSILANTTSLPSSTVLDVANSTVLNFTDGLNSSSTSPTPESTEYLPDNTNNSTLLTETPNLNSSNATIDSADNRNLSSLETNVSSSDMINTQENTLASPPIEETTLNSERNSDNVGSSSQEPSETTPNLEQITDSTPSTVYLPSSDEPTDVASKDE